MIYLFILYAQFFFWMEWGGATLPAPLGEGENAHVLNVVMFLFAL